jgi:hypothetical protein
LNRRFYLSRQTKVPPVVANSLQQNLGQIPGIEENILRATAQAITGITEQLQCERILRRTTRMPHPNAQRDSKRSIGPE